MEMVLNYYGSNGPWNHTSANNEYPPFILHFVQDFAVPYQSCSIKDEADIMLTSALLSQ
jgi:hypothetical protein